MSASVDRSDVRWEASSSVPPPATPEAQPIRILALVGILVLAALPAPVASVGCLVHVSALCVGDAVDTGGCVGDTVDVQAGGSATYDECDLVDVTVAGEESNDSYDGIDVNVASSETEDNNDGISVGVLATESGGEPGWRVDALDPDGCAAGVRAFIVQQCAASTPPTPPVDPPPTPPLAGTGCLVELQRTLCYGTSVGTGGCTDDNVDVAVAQGPAPPGPADGCDTVDVTVIGSESADGRDVVDVLVIGQEDGDGADVIDVSALAVEPEDSGDAVDVTAAGSEGNAASGGRDDNDTVDLAVGTAEQGDRQDFVDVVPYGGIETDDGGDTVEVGAFQAEQCDGGDTLDLNIHVTRYPCAAPGDSGSVTCVAPEDGWAFAPEPRTNLNRICRSP